MTLADDQLAELARRVEAREDYVGGRRRLLRWLRIRRWRHRALWASLAVFFVVINGAACYRGVKFGACTVRLPSSFVVP
jgi:hypothetical protein